MGPRLLLFRFTSDSSAGLSLAGMMVSPSWSLDEDENEKALVGDNEKKRPLFSRPAVVFTLTLPLFILPVLSLVFDRAGGEMEVLGSDETGIDL